MAIETSNSIAGLDETAPLSGDALNEGDNHLRLIKHVLKTIFPGSGGAGFSTPILANEAEINHLVGVNSSVQAQLTAALKGVFQVGTNLTFYNASAPTYWTKVTTLHDFMLRIVNDGSGATVGGIHSPILMDKVPGHTHITDPVAVDTSFDGSHNHSSGTYTYALKPPYAGSLTGNDLAGSGLEQAIGAGDGGQLASDGNHKHTVDIPSTTSSVNAGAVNWEPRYANVILCQYTG